MSCPTDLWLRPQPRNPATIDGDMVGNDGFDNKEAFQLIKGWNDATNTSFVPSIRWNAVSGDRPGGYVVEFRIALDSIDMIDGTGSASPGPGDAIGFTVAVGDDDNGGQGYNEDQVGGAEGELMDSWGAWDGDWQGGSIHSQQGRYGTLYFLPQTTSVEPVSWGEVKGEMK